MPEKKAGNPTKNDVIRLIKNGNYRYVYSKMLADIYSKKKPEEIGSLNKRGLAHSIGGILSELNNEKVLSVVSTSGSSTKYSVDQDMLLKAYESIFQSYPR